MGGAVFNNTANNFAIYHQTEATGFTDSSWQGYSNLLGFPEIDTPLMPPWAFLGFALLLFTVGLRFLPRTVGEGSF
jgi:hypothetical protein